MAHSKRLWLNAGAVVIAAAVVVGIFLFRGEEVQKAPLFSRPKEQAGATDAFGVVQMPELDEILKGTNSEDKQKGSKVVLEKIIRSNGTGIIATHDLELAKSEAQFPEHIKNKCFEVEIDGTEIFFNYKLVDGITKKMNATLLMKQMGIV